MTVEVFFFQSVTGVSGLLGPAKPLFWFEEKWGFNFCQNIS